MTAGPLPQSSGIRSLAKDELAAHWIGAVVWNGLFGTIATLILLGRIETTAEFWDWLLIALAGLGPILLARAVVASARVRRFRDVVLEQDPAPASPGGDLGGVANLPVRSTGVGGFRVVVVCVLRDQRGDQTSESIVWSMELRPVVHPTGDGLRLEFATPLPPDVPVSEAPADRYHDWTVQLAGDIPGLDLDLVFPVRVEASDAPEESRYSAAEPDPIPREGRLGPGVRVARSAGALRLAFGARRCLSPALVLLVFGVLCLASGGFIFWTTSDFGSSGGSFGLVFTAFGALFLLVFGGIGALLTLLAVWLVGHTMVLEVRPGRLRTRNRFLLVFRWKRELATADVERIEARVTSRVGTGARARVRYEVRAKTKDGRTTVIADGIRGPLQLSVIARMLERETGLVIEQVARGKRSHAD